eukprot:187726_1
MHNNRCINDGCHISSAEHLITNPINMINASNPMIFNIYFQCGVVLIPSYFASKQPSQIVGQGTNERNNAIANCNANNVQQTKAQKQNDVRPLTAELLGSTCDSITMSLRHPMSTKKEMRRDKHRDNHIWTQMEVNIKSRVN